MTALPSSLRDALVLRGYVTGRSRVVTASRAPDGATKLLLELMDGQRIECVSIPSRGKHLTACVSCQVGCAMACVFCATGRAGLARSLLPFEILDQVLHVRWLEEEKKGTRQAKRRSAGQKPPSTTLPKGKITHLVFMGQGEPAAALPSVLPALRRICGPWGLSMRGVTLSTVGVRGTLARLARENLALTLAVSLHAPSQALRAALVPSARAYPLGELLEDCAAYFLQTGRRISFEYVLLGGRNDQEAHAEQLVALLGRYRDRMRVHVNLIPWNAVEGAAFESSSEQAVQAFVAVLENARIPVTVRRSKGRGAQAACGQLKNAGKALVKDLLEG
ncbi:hypothetical protein H632_c3497p0 [Helicosporidium sp. ATCC 50920]|nr:hypothetical protein H632_c3497p0 [Helicosporidium sp. ATCC 50920]|eukprot:KDD72337.1 hypothetical protein H632_c3497p0 [Helicosporidium sp. ATCC 50920]